MATLDGFIDEVIARLKTTAIAQFVPDDPPESISDYPFFPVYSSSGDALAQFGGGNIKYLHVVQVGFLVPAQSIDLKNQIILPEIETVIESIFQPITSGTLYTNASTFGLVEYTYGPVEWEGIPLFGFMLTINDIKLQRTIT